MSKAKLGQLGEQQGQQEVACWRDGGDRRNATHVSAAEEAERPKVVTEWVWCQRRWARKDFQASKLGASEDRKAAFVDEDGEGRWRKNDNRRCLLETDQQQQSHTFLYQ